MTEDNLREPLLSPDDRTPFIDNIQSEPTGKDDESFEEFDFFSLKTSWAKRKEIALKQLKDPTTDIGLVYKLAYYGQVEELETLIRSEENNLEYPDLSSKIELSIFKGNNLKLTPIIYAIWGELDREEILIRKFQEEHKDSSENIENSVENEAQKISNFSEEEKKENAKANIKGVEEESYEMEFENKIKNQESNEEILKDNSEDIENLAENGYEKILNTSVEKIKEIDKDNRENIKEKADEMIQEEEIKRSSEKMEHDTFKLLLEYFKYFIRRKIWLKQFNIKYDGDKVGKMMIESGLLNYEIGHLFQHKEDLKLSINDIMYQDGIFNLQYLIEKSNSALNVISDTNSLKGTPLCIALLNKYTGCTDLLLEYTINLFNSNSADSFDRLEIELPYMVGSSNEKVPLLLENILIASKSFQLKSDQGELPIILFNQSYENLIEVRPPEFKDDANSEQVLNIQTFYSSIKLPFKNGSLSSLIILNSLISCQNPEVLSTPLMKYFILKNDMNYEYIFLCKQYYYEATFLY